MNGSSAVVIRFGAFVKKKADEGKQGEGRLEIRHQVGRKEGGKRHSIC